METLPAKPQKCLLLRNGLEIWLDAEIADQLGEDWYNKKITGVCNILGRYLNVVDFVGIVPAGDMETRTNSRNGQMRCKFGNWHDKGEKCDCINTEEKDRLKAMAVAIESCKVCGLGTKGYVVNASGAMEYCECLKPFIRE